MKKYLLPVLLGGLLVLSGCDTNVVGSSSSPEEVSSSETITSSESSESLSSESPSSEESVEQLDSPFEVFSRLYEARNYTIEVKDPNSYDWTYMYTEHAYYCDVGGQPSRSNIGYAEANGEVFPFEITDGEVVAGNQMVDSNGNKVTDLWAEAILSFYDFRLETLETEATPNNLYTMSTSDTNGYLLTILSGYGDAYVLPYLTLTLEITGEMTFNFYIDFSFEEAGSNYERLTLSVTNVGTTTLPGIEEYLANGGGAAKDDAESILETLTLARNSSSYLIKVTGSDGTSYRDLLNEDYYHSFNVTTGLTNRGYVAVAGGIYSFTVVDGEVTAGSEITYTSDDHTDLLANLTLSTLSNLNVSLLSFSEGETGYLLDYNASTYNTFLGLCHVSGFFVSPSESDTMTVTAYTENSFTYEYLYSSSSTTYTVKVSDIGTASDSSIEAFIEANKDFESGSIQGLIDKIVEAGTANNYTISVTNNIGSFSAYNTNIASIKVVGETYAAYDKDGSPIDVAEPKRLTDLNILELTGTASIGGVYTVSGTQYTQFLTLIGLSSEAAAYWSTGTFHVTSSGFSYTSTSGWYGGFTVTVSDIGTTVA